MPHNTYYYFSWFDWIFLNFFKIFLQGFICKLKILLNFKINIDSTNNIDESALFLVCRRNFLFFFTYTFFKFNVKAIRRCPEETAVEVVKCLLMFGADYNLFNSSGKNSLDIAKHLKKPQLVEAINVYVEEYLIISIFFSIKSF